MYWDIAVGGKLAGRVEFALFYKEAPLAAEPRALCTGRGASCRQAVKGRVIITHSRATDSTGSCMTS